MTTRRLRSVERTIAPRQAPTVEAARAALRRLIDDLDSGSLVASIVLAHPERSARLVVELTWHDHGVDTR